MRMSMDTQKIVAEAIEKACREACMADGAGDPDALVYQPGGSIPRYRLYEPEVIRHAVIRMVFNPAEPDMPRPASIAEPDMPRPASIAERDVMRERDRQNAKGFDAAHDAQHIEGELAIAAVHYLFNVAKNAYSTFAMSQPWPFEVDAWQPEGRRADLVKAAALIIAEIERLDRIDAEIIEADRQRVVGGET